MVRNFIFDIDGTLLNTFDMYMPALFTTLADHGISFAGKEEQLSTKMYGLAATSSLRALGVPKKLIPQINREWIKRAYEHVDRTRIIDGVPAVIQQLAANSRNKLAVVTSKTRAEYEKYVKARYAFTRYFAVVITADDTTEHKPHPAPISLAIRKMDAQPQQSVYIGDMPTDMQAAHAAGIKFAGAIYGSVNPAGIANADFCLNSPADLLTII